jgi:hypothetical protein
MSEQPTHTPTHTQSAVIEFVTAIDVPAPAELHGRIAALIAERGDARSGRSFLRMPALGVGLAGAVTLAVVVLAVVLASSGSTTPATPPSLSVDQASALTARSATMAPPAEKPGANAQLAANVDGVAFPYWEDHFGWRSTGARRDTIGGRSVMTVFYANSAGQQIGYAIVAGKPAPRLPGGVIKWRGGTPYRLLSSPDHHQLVVWLRSGHLCILSARGVNPATLVRLASWNDRDDVTA